MFRKYEEEYNPKIDFKMLFSINPLFNKEENFNEIKAVFKKQEKAVSKQAKKFNDLKEIFDFLKNIPIQNLSKIEFQKIAKKLEIKDADSEKVENLLSLFKNEEKDDTPTFSAKVFAFIVQKEIFQEISVEIGLLFMNAILYQNRYIPMVIFRNHFDFFRTLIKENITIESLVKIFANLKDVSMRYIDQFEQTTKQNIIDTLIEHQNEINEKFQVEKLWLYGSFVKDDTTSYSDVDLFVQMEDESKKEELRDYLFELLKRPVDIQVEGHYHPNFAMYPALIERELIFDVSQ